jgi:hypothetical protein
LANWRYEEGIGENRAILVEGDHILEARIELPGRVRTGTVRPARLSRILIPGKRGIATFAEGEALIEPLPATLTEGGTCWIEIVREEMPEPGRPKLPKARITEMEEREGPSLIDQVSRDGTEVATAHLTGPDRFEEAGWSELIEEAVTGEILFEGGALRMSLTPAMTLFDVDGALPPAALAAAGAQAAARAIRRLGIGGSIGIDLPTVPSKADRQAAAEALDAALPQPFERTAVNGFGFLQVVRRRERPSIPELLRAEPATASARALLRKAERHRGAGTRTLDAAPGVIVALEQNPEWLKELEQRTGAIVALRPEPSLSIWAGHVHSQFA